MIHLNAWPKSYNYADAFDMRKVTGGKPALVSLDWEYHPKSQYPTVLGVATGPEEGVSVEWGADARRLITELCELPNVTFLGHNVISADRPVTTKATGIEVPLERWEDTMLRYYLCHSNFTTMAKSGYQDDDDEGEGDGDRRGVGLLGLWHLAALYSDFPQWKMCRGDRCSGPCPEHDPLGYNTVDLAVPLVAHPRLLERYRTLGIPEEVYERTRAVAEIADLMQRQGIKIDRPLVEELEAEFAANKARIFPEAKIKVVTPCGVCARMKAENRPCKKCSEAKYGQDDEGVGLRVSFEDGFEAPFNPRSPAQVLAWFREHGVFLSATDKQEIFGELERLGGDDAVGEAAEWLGKLYDFKDAGKGLTPWFSERYFTGSFIHPRFNPCGTATGRFSSSNPNAQNCPKQGFGRQVRRAFIPRDPDLQWVKADYRQIELRAVLWYAFVHTLGQDMPPMGDDFYTETLHLFGNNFDRAAKLMGAGRGPRDVYKSVAYGCLTGDHEVLTPTGWVRIDEWENQQIAVWHDDEITFELPEKYWEYEAAEVDLEHFKTRGLEALSTSNHQWPVVKTGTWQGHKYRKIHKIAASEVKKHSGRIPICGELQGASTEFYTERDIRQAVAIQADGSYAGNRVRFQLKKKRKIERVKLLFPDDFRCLEENKHNGASNFSVPRPHNKLLTGKSKEFHLPELLKLTPEQRRIFLDELLLWDGCVTQGGGRKIYLTTSQKSAEAVQTLAHISGQQALLRSTDRPGRKRLYIVSFNTRKYSSIRGMQTEKRKETLPVYCFTTSSGYFLYRYRGTVGVTGNSNYMEGSKRYTHEDTKRPYIRKQIESGALVIHEDWPYAGGFVGFTGINLAERLFGSRSNESRAEALALQETYFSNVPQIREWQRTLTTMAEEGQVRTATGRVIDVEVPLNDRLKVIAATLGQGMGAEYMHEAMLKTDRAHLPTMNVHDELSFELPRAWSDARLYEFMDAHMHHESKLFPGFKCPIEIEAGDNWLDCETLEWYDGAVRRR